MVSWEEAQPLIASIPGRLVPGMFQEEWLFWTARSLGPGAVVLEVGAFKGCSTAALAFGVGPQGRVLSIDPFCGEGTDFWCKEDFLRDWADNMIRLGFVDTVNARVGKSSEFWEDWDIPLDLLFIDGSHELEDVEGDFRWFYPWVKGGGWVMMHDVAGGHQGPTQVWKSQKHLLEETGMIHNLGFGKKPQ